MINSIKNKYLCEKEQFLPYFGADYSCNYFIWQISLKDILIFSFLLKMILFLLRK